MGGWSARASAWIATFGVICFVARFGPWKGVIPFGWLNDVSSLLQYLLAIPVALALHEILTFDQQGGPVSIAILVVGVWLVATGYLLRSAATFRRSLLFSLLAIPYFGYPVWAFWLSRRLLACAGDPARLEATQAELT
jgi:hypothetical protein